MILDLCFPKICTRHSDREFAQKLLAAVCLFCPPRRRCGVQRFLQSRDAPAYSTKGLDVGASRALCACQASQIGFAFSYEDRCLDLSVHREDLKYRGPFVVAGLTAGAPDGHWAGAHHGTAHRKHNLGRTSLRAPSYSFVGMNNCHHRRRLRPTSSQTILGRPRITRKEAK